MPSQTTTEELETEDEINTDDEVDTNDKINTNDEVDTEEEIVQPSRIDSLKARIKNHHGDTPIEISSDEYIYVNTQEVEEIANEIGKNTNINSIDIGVTVSTNGAEHIVRSFLRNEYAEELRFHIFGRVADPSQLRLMRTEDDLKGMVDSHNYLQERNQQTTLFLLSVMNNRKRQRQAGTEEAPTQTALPSDVLRTLQPMITSKKKRLISE